jgi:predicted Zn-dependent peptidase
MEPVTHRLTMMYQKTVLENGIRIVTETMPEVRSVAIGIIIDVGLNQEPPAQSGLAHLTEHLMFQGTSSRDAMQIARLMDVAGGRMGAFTTRDYVCYYATVLDEFYTYALDLLGDILLNSIFPPSSLEREKAAILREIEGSCDMPMERVHMRLKESAWPCHPLGRPITGKPETVRKLTREHVIYFTHEHYLPDRMIIAAAGPLVHEDIIAHVRDAFWRMLGQSKPTTSVPPSHQAGLTLEYRPVSQAYFSLGMSVYPYPHPQRYGMHVLNHILGGGISSRLFRHIREQRGLVYDIGSEYQAYRYGGMWVIEGSTAPEYLMSVLTLTLIELWQLVTGAVPVDDDELWKAKTQIRAQHLIAAEDTYTRMSRLATQELYFGRHIPSTEILDQIEAVDRSLLQNLGEDLLAEALRQVAVAIVGPEAPEHYNQATIEELLASFQ